MLTAAAVPGDCRERERERRLESRDAHGGKRSKLTRDRDRDVSEKIALGQVGCRMQGVPVLERFMLTVPTESKLWNERTCDVLLENFLAVHCNRACRSSGCLHSRLTPQMW